MAAGPSSNVAELLRERLQSASPDLLRAMVKTFADVLMSAEVDAVCGAEYGERGTEYGERGTERTNSRNGYRHRDWDTRAGAVELAIPKLRSGVVDLNLESGVQGSGWPDLVRSVGCRGSESGVGRTRFGFGLTLCAGLRG